MIFQKLINYFFLFSLLFSACSFDVIPVALQNLLDTPTGLSAIAVSDTRIDITWNTISQNADYYVLERTDSLPDLQPEWSVISNTNLTSYSNTGLTPQTKYFYRIKAYKNENESRYSGITSATTKTAGSLTPNTPTGLTILTKTSSSVKLSWQDNSDNETGFKIFRAEGTSGIMVQIAIIASNSTLYSDNNYNFKEGAIYRYIVHSFNNIGDSLDSNEVSCIISINYTINLINSDTNPPMIDSVELGIGRNDNLNRLYTTRSWDESSGYEYSFSGNEWIIVNNFNALSYCSSPIIADINNTGNSLYLGGWNNLGILMLSFNNIWSSTSILTGSDNKGTILSMKAGDGRNDGITRLYAAHSSASGLIEYSWNGSGYTSNQLINKSVGRFAIGKGRNDGINRIYMVERGGTALHELTWNGTTFTDEIIFNGNVASNGSVHIADGRGDGINRIYVWAGGLFEVTYNNGTWSTITIDEEYTERYYINAGTIRNNSKPGIYVSAKLRGLYEYIWSEEQNKYEVDVITGATGGCSIGDGRGDGKNRLYVARGTKGNYTNAAVVEIWEEDDD